MIVGPVTIQDRTAFRCCVCLCVCVCILYIYIYTTIATWSLLALWLRVAIACDAFPGLPVGLGPWVAILSNMFLLQSRPAGLSEDRASMGQPKIPGFIHVYHCLSVFIIICLIATAIFRYVPPFWGPCGWSSNSHLARHPRASNPWMPGWCPGEPSVGL